MIFYFSIPENLGLRDYLKIIRLIYKRNCPTLFEALHKQLVCLKLIKKGLNTQGGINTTRLEKHVFF